MKFFFVCILFVNLIFSAACKNSKSQEGYIDKTLISFDGRVSAPIYLDSFQITNFLHQNSLNKNYNENLESFYKKRNNEFVWINSIGVNEYTRNFISLLNNEKRTNKRYLILP